MVSQRVAIFVHFLPPCLPVDDIFVVVVGVFPSKRKVSDF